MHGVVLAWAQSVRAARRVARALEVRLGWGGIPGRWTHRWFQVLLSSGMSHRKTFSCLDLDLNLKLGMAWRAVVGDRRSEGSGALTFLLPVP